MDDDAARVNQLNGSSFDANSSSWGRKDRWGHRTGWRPGNITPRTAIGEALRHLLEPILEGLNNDFKRGPFPGDSRCLRGLYRRGSVEKVICQRKTLSPIRIPLQIGLVDGIFTRPSIIWAFVGLFGVLPGR